MRWIRYVAIAIVVYLFVNPFYVFPDGLGYFAYLPSLFFDGDLQLYNNFTDMRIPVPMALTSTGYISNNWSFGAAFFWTPFYLAARALGDTAYSNHSSWYWHWLNFGTIFFGLLAAWLLSGILKKLQYHKKNIPLLTGLAFIGTPMFFYTFVLSSTAHGISSFITTLFLWYWIYSLDDHGRAGRYVVLGILLGMAAMVRPQEALFGLALVPELLSRAKDRAGVRNLFAFGAVLGIFFLLGVSPQLFVWKFINGSFFAAPAKFNLSLDYFSLRQVLFSSYHGLLAWTPVFLIGFAGLLLGVARNPKVFTGLLLVFLAQVFTNSCCVAFWEGYSFGLRQMTSSLPLAALGLAEFVRFFEGRAKAIKFVGWSLVVLPCLWTAGLVANYYLGLSLLEYISWQDILLAQKMLPLRLITVIGKIFETARPSFSSFLMMVIFGLAFLFGLRQLKEVAEKKKAVLAAAILLALIAVYDVLLINAHRQKPEEKLPRGNLVSEKDLDTFFMQQVQELKTKYGL